MQLIAYFRDDQEANDPLEGYGPDDYLLHSTAAARPLHDSLHALTLLGFAGAFITEPDLQREAYASMNHTSIDARAVGAVDAVTVTAAGLSGDYSLGRALGNALYSEGWDPRGARVVVLGGGTDATIMAQELASRGAKHLTLLAKDRPTAEQALPRSISSAELIARSASEPLAKLSLEQADILLRTDARLEVDPGRFGPHLSIIDLAPSAFSRLRKSALDVGAKSLGRRDIRAHQTSLALSQILGRRLGAETFLSLFHAETS